MLVGALLLLVLLYLPVSGFIRACQSYSFTRTTGTVKSIRVHWVWDRIIEDGGGDWHVDVVYEYRVRGEAYTGHQVGYFQRLSHQRAQAIGTRFPAGSHPSIYYNPKYPAQAVLEPGLRAHWEIMFSVMMAVGALEIWLFWRALRPKSFATARRRHGVDNLR